MLLSSMIEVIHILAKWQIDALTEQKNNVRNVRTFFTDFT